jgi:hypothetical protein
VAKSGEHRMLFDLRGRRKRVIQVAFGGLALLMALSLFTVTGGASLGDLFGGSSGTSSSSSVFDDQAKQIERKLAKDPKNPKLLATDVKVRYTAGNAQVQTDPSTGQTSVTQEAVDDFNRAGDAWQRYIKVTTKPDPGTAAFAVKALTGTVTTGTPVALITDNLNAAVGAQKIVATAQPSLGSYATLAQLAYFAGETKTGAQAASKALALAPKSQRVALQQSIPQYKKGGAAFQKQIKAAEKSQAGGGKQALENPLGGLSGGGSGAGATAP